MSDVEQATSPVISSPMELDSEALRPTDILESMRKAVADKAAQDASIAKPDPKPIGRPRGSRNRSTVEREAAGAGQPSSGRSRVVVPPTRPRSTTDKTEPKSEAELAQIAAAKAARARELAEKISESVNDNIILALTSMGVPASLLYKPGKIPPRVAESEVYSEFAGNLIISPQQAQAFGKFAAELEGTNAGKKMSAATGGGNGPLVISGLVAAFAAVQYAQGVANAYTKLKPMLDQYKAMQALQEQQEQARQQGVQGA